MGIDHYENFPVASVLCPPRIRPAVLAIYRFARTADDLADEGDAPATERLATLSHYRQNLAALYAGRPVSGPWDPVFSQLDQARLQFSLPHQPLDDLLDAFMQDTGNPLYPNRASLLDYCRRSANPVGRLLLHLYGIQDARSLAQSDAICSALQLINFWQDLSVDLPRGRVYLPLEDALSYGVPLDQPSTLRDSEASRRLVQALCAWARELMLAGAPLALTVPGRAGWELRLVVQGGLRILEKIQNMQWATVCSRPQLSRFELLQLLWRAACMRPGQKGLQEGAPA